MAAKVTVNLDQQSPTTTAATIRQHTVLVDRPVAKEGTDAGPMGGELLLAGLGGCFMSNLLAAVRARQAPVSNIHTTVTGTLVDAPTRFSAIELTVNADCDDRDLLEKLVTIAERGCLAAQTMKHAVDLTITIAEPVS